MTAAGAAAALAFAVVGLTSWNAMDAAVPAPMAPAPPPVPLAPTESPAEPAMPTAAPTPAEAPKPASPPPEAASGVSPPLTLALRERIEETRQWLDRADDDRWFVQLTTGSAGEMAGVGDYLARTDQLLQTGRAGLYLAETAASTRIGVIYGDFPSRKAANQAIDQLPDELKLQRPFARKVAWLKQGRT
ncbi:MAG: SPOR domain-containing protein [Rhodocyclaceae bacterium]|nr:SPOR domain-containing protein [Rhodocyclaceae bacterium]